MSSVKRIASSSIGAAILGGLVVGLLGWIAIAAGWVHSSNNDTSTSFAALSTPPPAPPRRRPSRGERDRPRMGPFLQQRHEPFVRPALPPPPRAKDGPPDQR